MSHLSIPYHTIPSCKQFCYLRKTLPQRIQAMTLCIVLPSDGALMPSHLHFALLGQDSRVTLPYHSIRSCKQFQ